MTPTRTPLAPHLAAPTRLGAEISITGKWVPATPGTFFRASPDAPEMRQEWQDIHAEARAHDGVLATEVNHAIGEDAVLVHHVFRDADALLGYFGATATAHKAALTAVARPELHLVRGAALTPEVRAALADATVAGDFADYRFGYVKHDHQQPDPARAIGVTAKWTCHEGDENTLEELLHWWQCVGTDAFEMEAGLVRFEVYEVVGEEALIIHEVFEDTAELRFHLTRGTAAKYKKQIDRIAAPECYFFRGPVSWDIRTYSKFMGLPATYTQAGPQFRHPAGSMSEGLPEA